MTPSNYLLWPLNSSFGCYIDSSSSGHNTVPFSGRLGSWLEASSAVAWSRVNVNLIVCLDFVSAL